MHSYRYDVYGLTVASNFPLALPEADSQSGNPGVKLELVGPNDFSTVPVCWPLDKERYRQVFLDDGSIYMGWQDLFDFVISADGRRVQCRRLSDVEFESLEAYLTGFAISGALLQQGEETLHATVVATEKGIFGLIGASGAGKSTLAAYLIGRGGKLVTDDLLRLEFRSGVAAAFPGPRRIKLFKESAQRFLKQSMAQGRFNPLTDKFIFEAPPMVDGGNGPWTLSALYLLEAPEEAAPDGISIERLSGIELFKTIAGSAYNSGLNTNGRSRRHFLFAKRIASTIPVYRLIYPRDYDMVDQVADLVERTASS